MDSEHDQAFLQILRDEKNITNFLDAFFGFLYRCTDFYVECDPEQKLGFPPGIAQKLVLNSLHKWQNTSKFAYKSDISNDENSTKSKKIVKNTTIPLEPETDAYVPPIQQEIEIESCEVDSKTERFSNEAAIKKETREESKLSDSYNGAVRENYTWSQTINDLDVLVKLPNDLRTTKDIKVSVDSQRIKIERRTSPSDVIFDGELCFKIKRDESIWSIIPGQQISIHLEKATERWWDALILGEPKIELNKIDCTRDLHDMGSAEQMKVQELMWNHQQKLLGKPTSDQIKLEQMLKKAWDAQGSPFQGTPYDPSIVKFN